MAKKRSLTPLSALRNSRKFRDKLRQKSRRMHMEHLEDRRVMATLPVVIQPNNTALLNAGDTRNIAPKDLTFSFAGVPGIDPATISAGIKLTRAGNDGTFGANDVVITPGFIGPGKNSTEVIMRFAETLPDDIYRLEFFGSATTPAPNAPILDTNGVRFNGGVDYALNFRLDLGAQVVAVVTQPVRRVNGVLEMTEPIPGNPTQSRSTRNIIHVYFNNDDLDVASAQRKEFYRLYVTRNTLDPNDDTEILPDSVEYDPVLDKATLIFGTSASPLNLDQLAAPIAGDPDAGRSLRLRIGTDEGRRLQTTQTLGLAASQTPVVRLTSDPGSSFLPTLLGTPFDIGVALTAGVQGSTVAYAQAIEAQPYDLDWPGGEDEPGHREIPVESHIGPDPLPAAGGLNALFDTTDGISTVFYNFQPVIGTIPDGRGGTQPAFNLITDNQKERAREIFALYSKYSGIQFVESDSSGITVATGDLRALDPTIPTGPGGVAGLAGPTLAIMDNAELWNDLYGQNWFQVAMHEIGHSIGQGHTYDLPPLTIQGSDPSLQFNSPTSEPVFPGDHDIAHMRHMYRPEGKDIDLYKFTLDGAGVLSAETFAERLPNASNLDTMLRLYQVGAGGAITEIARNDDYFSMDSHLQLTLGAGTYYIGVSAAGNDKYDPTITDSGMFGTTQGVYELKLDFRKSATQSIVDAVTPASPNPVPVITDNQAVAFDGDADGTPGGVYNFWFRAVAPTGSQDTGKARVLFVDKAAPAANNSLGTAGSLATPYSEIDVAIAAAQPYDIVRIVGNDPLNNDAGAAPDRFRDNLPYRIGFDDLGVALPDGASLEVPKDVTVVIDAGAVFQMRRSSISVGSTDPSAQSDRSGGALQVQGTPYSKVIFTSLNEDGPNGIGTDYNTLVATTPAPAQWGGISFKNDIDRADGRFDAEQVGVFLNYVNNADIRYGGGQVQVNSNFIIVNPIDMISSRPTITFNTITRAGDAAMAANPDAFEETNFQAPIYFPTFSDSPFYSPSGGVPLQTTSYTLDYDRVGPDIHGNRLVEVLANGTVIGNTTNGLFVRTRTPAGSELEELTVAGRFNDTDIVHVLQENLVVRGTPAGATLEQTPPPTGLIIVANPALNDGFAPIAGNFAAGDVVEYKLTYIDLLGNEGIASQTFTLPGNVTANGSAIKLSQLPDPDVPNPSFVARRLYRRINGLGANGDSNFTLVDQIPASASEYVDTRAPKSGFVPTLKVLSTTIQRPRLDASLVIDPSIVVKADGARIEVGHGANLLAEGQAGREVVFTSLADDRYGAGGTFDTKNDNFSTTPKTPLTGDWGGIFFSSDSKGSIDNAVFAYGGGLSRIEGNFAGFNVVEVHQAVVRVANSRFEFNDDGAGGQAPGDRSGRGANDTATIFVRGAQPIVINNTAISNFGPLVNINANGLNSEFVVDSGRMTDLIARVPGHQDNNGPLIFGNKLRNNTINGMVVRGATLTTESVWDDTDIVHVLRDAINVPDFHTFGGLRLESASDESLVIKALGQTAGFTATGRPLEIDDRIGGTLQVLGQPGFPVIMTSLNDASVGAGTTPEGTPQNDTNNTGPQNVAPIVDVMLLFDDTGSFAGTAPTLASAFTQVVTNLGLAIPGASFAFGVSRFEDYSSVGGGATDRPFILSQPIIDTTLPNFNAALTAALNRSTPGFGGDLPESAIEGLFQLATGVGFDGNGDGDRTDSGPAGLVSTQVAPGPGGDVPPFSSFVPDASGPVLAASGNVGGGGFRGTSTHRIVLLATDAGFAYEPDAVDPYVGFGGVTVPAANVQLGGRGTTPGGRGARIQQTVNALLANNIQVIGLGTSALPAVATPLQSMARLTGAVDAAGNPLYFVINTGSATTISNAIVNAVAGAVGTPAAAGDWQGITLDRFSNDRNVETVLEQESASGDGLANSVPQKAQYLGGLGLNEKGSDENLRLGFTVHGSINQNSDVDVYSFQAKSGTEVWIDLDRTTMALDSVVELVNNTGVVLARSNDSTAENAGALSPEGIARKMQKNPPHEGQDFYTINTRDAGMRVVLQGPANTTNTYFLRVRSGARISVTELSQGGVVNEVQRLTLDGPPTGGTFTLIFNGQTTAAIPYNATAAVVKLALENLSNIAPGDVVVSGADGGPFDIAFQGVFANQNLVPIGVNANGLIGGLTSGAYQMQVRLREIDEIGGSTVRFAKIGYAVDGIRVLGQPTHSPLGGEQTEGAGNNNTQLTAQNTGNLLNTDRGTMAIAGNITGAADIDWYRFDVSYGATQNLLPSGAQFWETIFDMDYTDGLARPNTAFYVFDTTGRLILSSRDSNVADDQPGPAAGSGISDLTRGSAGGADPYIGTYALPAGVGAPITYYIAVASDAQFPAQMDQFFQANATSPLFRLEPLDSVHRIVEDRVNSFLTRSTSSAPDQTTLVDANSAVPFNLGDVVLYINMSGIGDTERTQLVTVDPFTGENETDLGVIAQDYHDIVFSQDNRLFTLTRDHDDPGVTLKDSQSGNYLEIDTETGTSSLQGDDGIITYDSRPVPPTPANNPFGQAIQYNAMAFSDIDAAVNAGNRTNERLIAVGNRGDIFTSTDPLLNRRRNIAYSLSPTTGQALVDQGATHIYPQASANNALTDAFELGEILTSPRLRPVRDATDGVGPAGWAFTEGLTFDVQTDVSTNTFEFDAGYEVQQNFNFATDSVIRDGYFFILDQDTSLRSGNETLFQFDAGVSLAVTLSTNSTLIPDGSTFTVTAGGITRIFEFDSNGMLGTGTVGIDIQTFFPGPPVVNLPPFTADVIAAKIAAAINTQTSATFPVQALVGPSGARISLVATGNQPPNFINASVFNPGLINRLVRDGETGAAPVIQAIDPTSVGSPVAGDLLEGRTFSLTINTTGNPLTNPRITFEFSADAALAQPASNSYVRVDTSGIFPPLGTPLPNANSTTLASRIAGAINGRATLVNAELPLAATQLGDRVMLNGAGMVSNGAAPTASDPYFAGTAGLIDLASGVANGGLQTVLIQSEESFTADQIGRLISTTVINNSIYTAGGAFDRVNFPPPLITAPGTKVTPQGIDVTGVPIWVLQATSAPGVSAGNLAIPFLANDDTVTPLPLNLAAASGLGARIAAHINQVLTPAEGIVASVFGNNVELNRGKFVLATATPPANYPLVVEGEGPGGNITGLWDITPAINTQTRTYLAVSDQGGVYIAIVDYLANQTIAYNPPNAISNLKVEQIDTIYIGSTENDFAGLTAFQGLTRGPANVEGGRYNNTFFSVVDGPAGPTDQNSMLAFNFDTTFVNPAVTYPQFVAGLTSNVPATLAAARAALDARYTGLAPVFADGQSSVPLFYTDSATASRLPVRNAKGLAFSSLDRNLWHISGTRGAEPGHGINANNNGSRPASAGGSSYFFSNDGASQWVGNTYDFPGGAYGSIITNEFDLSGYSTYDQPVLYFNYRANAEQSGIFDSFRVFASGVADTDRDGIPDNNPGEWTQITSTASNVFVGQGWRQVRLSLDSFAGMSNLRLRFDFSTGGDMNTGDTFTTGDELRAVKGEYIRDGQTFEIDGGLPTATTFEFDGGPLLTFPSGQLVGDGETFTIDDGAGPVTFEFDKPGTPAANPANIAINITSTMTADQVVLQAFQAILQTYPITPTSSIVPRMLGGTKLTPYDGSAYVDGWTFTIDDATSAPQTFEFEDVVNGPPGVAPGNIAIPFDPVTPWNQARMAQEIVRAIRSALPLQVTPTFEAPNQVLVENAIQVTSAIPIPFLFADLRYYSSSNILQIENAVSPLIQGGGFDIFGAAIPPRIQAAGDPTPVVPGPGNIVVHYNIGQRATDIAATIDGLLEQVFYTPKISFGNGSQYQDGQIFTIDDDGPTGPNPPITAEFESGYIITVPTKGGDPLALPAGSSFIDGDQISIDDDGALGPNPPVVFQFVDASLAVPAPFTGDVAVNFLETQGTPEISRALVAAINASGLNVFSRVVAGSNVQIDTTGNPLVEYAVVNSVPPGKYSVGTTLPGVTAGNLPVLFAQTSGFNSANVVTNVIAAFAGQFPTVTLGIVPNAISQVAFNGADARFFTLTVPNPQPGGLPQPPITLQTTSNIAKRDRDLLQVIGHTVTDRGPLGLEVPTTGIVPLQSDVPDLNDGVPVADGYRSIRRGQNNNFEGVYIDDFVIGLAERGEMGTNGGAVGATNTNFAANPQLNPNQILVGAYQLEIRRSPTYEFVNTINPGLTPDSNDRFTNSYTIDVPAGSNIADGQTFTLSDGINRVTFEFDELPIAGNPLLPNSIIAGNQRIPFSPSDTSDVIAHAIRDAINSVAVQSTLKLMASLGDGTLPGVVNPAGLPSTTTRVNIVGAATTTVQNLQTQNAAEINPAVGNDTIATALPTGFLGSQYFIHGTIGDNPVLSLNRGTQADDVDLFSFVVTAAQAANPNYRVRIDIDAESLGSTLDSVLRVFDAAGNELAISDDDFAPGEQQPGELTTLESYLEFDPLTAGTYYVGVSSDGFYDPNSFGSAFGFSAGWYQLELTSALPSAVEPIVFTDKLGDWNHFRDQGQILLFGNEISNASQWGIVIDSGARSGTDGNAPHQGPPRQLREINTSRQVPGVVAMNNTIYNGALGGILFSGDPLGDASVPFGRLVNNSLYGRGGTLTNGASTDIGISVTDNAAPTLLNNIVANFRTGVNVDATSQGLTILGGMLYQGNTTNSNVGLGGDFPIVLANNQPLFVNPQQGNFYLRAQSQAIDSAVDSLLDRPAMVTVRDPLGISPSPILSPDRDGVGQLRVNDPDVGTPQGFGLNPFKDRGAIDRVDFTGPSSFLDNPLDNDAAGLDLDAASTVVVLSNRVVNDFRIRLLDRSDPNGPPEGSDIDDLTVTTAQVVVEEISTGTPVLLVDGINYNFSYDATNNVIILTPTGGLWPLSQTYRITLNNAAVGGIADRAGNILNPNQVNGSHTYTIFLGTAKDWGDAPNASIPPTGGITFNYPTRAADGGLGGASHSISPGFQLGDTVGAEGDGQPSLGATADSGDDGITNIILQPGLGPNSSSIDVRAIFPAGTTAILDGWIDTDRSGTFDAGERFFNSVTIVASNVTQTIQFEIPGGPRGDTYARFRLTSTGIATPDGPALDGEVEDYQVTLVGPAFTNPGNAYDVNNDGIVSPTDLLTVINFITFLNSKRDTSVDPDGAGPLGNFTLFLPPTTPGYFAPAPTFDPTGGNVPGFGKYVDVAAPFGVLDVNNDLLGLINYIIANFSGAGGEGEAPAAAAASGSAAAGQTASFSAPAVLFASSSVVIEERTLSSLPVLAGAELLPNSDTDTLDLAFVDGNLLASPAWGSLADHARRKAAPGPLALDQDDWEELLGDLALDLGGLEGGDPGDQA